MMARVIVTINGAVSPLRVMVSVIWVFGLPRMRFTASFSVMPFTGVSSSLMIRSPGLMPALCAGRVLDRRDHLDEAVFHADLDAQAAELALGADLQLAERLGVEIGRVRVEAGEHAVDRLGDELLVLDRLDVVGLDRAEHLGERAQLLDRQRGARGAVGDRLEVQADQNAGDGADDHESDVAKPGVHDARFISA